MRVLEPGGSLATVPGEAAQYEGRIVRIAAQDDLKLAARLFGRRHPRRLPMLCLAGLSRNSRDFIRLGQYLAERPDNPRLVAAVDVRGRGLSAADRRWHNYTPLVEAQDAMTAAAALGIEKAVIVGTSRGGILAMVIGLLRPGLIGGVVLNDIGPVIEGTGLARIKKYLSNRRQPRDWEEAVGVVKRIQAAQFPALDETDWRAMAEATFVEDNGVIKPRFDPNLLKMVDGIDLETALPVLWNQFDGLLSVPVMSIRGEHSDILRPETVDAMEDRHPHFERLTVPGQGHAPLLRDFPTLERIAAFARRCDALADR
jgi:pimeloyl-ACP methyl ester carboxylesterase